MKRIIAVVILLFVFQCSYTQSYKAFDGTYFKVGDTITVGLMKYKKQFVNIYSADFDSPANCIPFNKYVILDINTTDQMFKRLCHDPSAVKIKVGIKSGVNATFAYINLESAIKDGEVVLKLDNLQLNRSLPVINQEVSFLIFSKLSKLPHSVFSEEYLYRCQNDKYRQVIADEFEFKNAIREAEFTIKNEHSRTNIDKDYAIVTEVELGDYNFENSSFPYDLNDVTFDMARYGYGKSMRFPSIKLSFVNSNMKQFLLVGEKEANSFIKRRKNSSGSVNRRVFAVVWFRFSNENVADFSSYPKLKEYWLKGSITNVGFYEFDNLVYNWLGTVSYK